MKTILATAALALLGGGAVAQDNPMVGGAPMFADRTIVENAVNSADHTTLVAAVQAAGLVETLSGAGPFTVFAPVNDAFAALPAGTVDTLLMPENKEQLTKVLLCHVVADEITSQELMDMIGSMDNVARITTVGGCVIEARIVDGGVQLTDETGGVGMVTIPDVMQSNGVIHVVDRVLLPAM